MSLNSINYIAKLKIIEEQMVEIQSGEILLRDDRKKQTWNVQIKPFLISKFLVTQDIYFALTNQLNSAFKEDKNPVENVSWKEAVSFCNLLSQKTGLQECYSISDDIENIHFNPDADGYRLPSDAEWEYACKAGTTKIRYGEIDDIAWYKENSENKTHNVGLKEPNEWGLYDMLGNVWEWCSDIYDDKVYGIYRVIRGGGWYDEARGCMATNRRRSHPTLQIDDLGFRLARNLPEVKN